MLLVPKIYGELPCRENKELKCLYPYIASTSVSPSPKKGHGKVAKKGHFLTRGSMSKGHFQHASASKRALLRAHLCTVIKFNPYYKIFSIISNLLFSLNCSFLNCHISGFSFTRDNLEIYFPSASLYFNTGLTIRDNLTYDLF